tara:strand:+ start:3018 stop:3272 length:255 start_codon:yes stop_codon:yes gene_type:complete
MSDKRAKAIVALLISAAEAEARKALPSYILDSWLEALSSVIESGLYHAWEAIVANIEHIELNADVIEIIDRRTGSSEDTPEPTG